MSDEGRTKWEWTGMIILLGAATPLALAQSAGGAQGPPSEPPLSVGQAFTFLFLTLGPFNVQGPFLAMTLGRDSAFKRWLAFGVFIVSVCALVAAASVGANTLKSWAMPTGALELAAGIILFLVALQPVLAQYKPKERAQNRTAVAEPTKSISDLAFSLAFPGVVTPYGIAVLILLSTLRPAATFQILIIAIVVLVLDLLAMLGAALIAENSFHHARDGYCGIGDGGPAGVAGPLRHNERSPSPWSYPNGERVSKKRSIEPRWPIALSS